MGETLASMEGRISPFLLKLLKHELQYGSIAVFQIHDDVHAL